MAYGINEVSIFSERRREALRFDVTVNAVTTSHVVGDGAVFSTSFGSTGHFRSLTGLTFDVNAIGIGYAAPISRTDNRILPLNADIKIKVTRGAGRVWADNSADEFTLTTGESCKIMIPGTLSVMGIHHFCEVNGIQRWSPQ